MAGRDDINSLEQAIRTLTLLKGERECSDQITRLQESVNKKKGEARNKKKKTLIMISVIAVVALVAILAVGHMITTRPNVKFEGLSMRLTGDWKQAGDVQKLSASKSVDYKLGDTDKVVDIMRWNKGEFSDASEVASSVDGDDDYEVYKASDYDDDIDIKGVDETYVVLDKSSDDDETYIWIVVSKDKKVYTLITQVDESGSDYDLFDFEEDVNTIKIE